MNSGPIYKKTYGLYGDVPDVLGGVAGGGPGPAPGVRAVWLG